MVEQVENLGGRLRKVRLATGMSLREVSRQLGVSPSFVSQLENGKSQPSVATLYSLAQLLGVSIDELFVVEGGAARLALGPRDDADGTETLPVQRAVRANNGSALPEPIRDQLAGRRRAPDRSRGARVRHQVRLTVTPRDGHRGRVGTPRRQHRR